ncbi:unnamed protein product [Staurois parvus]|uniref:Uncharacterized protein n=1 Tax=Staurois parvus TaxID=386267 RepID=A0ABN9HBX5_9NEOB|nr:unnamed protein product [Staurois parvus]
MGPCTASPCCCQARNLPWVSRNRLLMLLTQARNLPCGPCTAPPQLLLPGPECVMGPCTASHCLLSLSHHSLPLCHFQVSLTLLVVSIFLS